MEKSIYKPKMKHLYNTYFIHFQNFFVCLFVCFMESLVNQTNETLPFWYKNVSWKISTNKMIWDQIKYRDWFRGSWRLPLVANHWNLKTFQNSSDITKPCLLIYCIIWIIYLQKWFWQFSHSESLVQNKQVSKLHKAVFRKHPSLAVIILKNSTITTCDIV